VTVGRWRDWLASGEVPRTLRAVPYAVGLVNFAAVTLVYATRRGTFLGGDSSEFFAIAEALRSGALVAAADNAKPLGYPLLLALVTSLPGTTVANALVLNAALYLGTLGIVGRLARRLNAAPVAVLITQTLFALLVNATLWANLLLSDTLAMLLFASSLEAYLAMEAAAEGRGRLVRAGLLGMLVGALCLTRSEYVALLGLVIPGLLAWRLRAHRHPIVVALTLGAVWVGAVPFLAVQPLVTGWRGLLSFVPPGQSGFANFWGSQYDLEFTQYRFHRVYRLAEEVSQAPARQTPIKSRVEALKHNYVGAMPIDDARLEKASSDVERVRAYARDGKASREAYRDLVLEWAVRDPAAMVTRALRRAFLFVTGDTLDWPRSQPVYWLYTAQFRPLSILAYATLALVLVGGSAAARRTMTVVGLWMVYPVAIHSWLVFEQRFAYPSIPMLCVAGGHALHTLWSRVAHEPLAIAGTIRMGP
jgi:hypothetical protein